MTAAATSQVPWVEIVSTALLLLEYAIKVAAIGFVPERRSPSSSSAWLLVIFFLPVVGLPLFLLLGSPYVRGRRHRIQAEANEHLDDGLAHLPSVPPGVTLPRGLDSLVRLNRTLTSLPMAIGVTEGLYDSYTESIRQQAAAIDAAREYVHVEIYIMSLDETTAPFFTALRAAAERGVKVRVLMDHLGSRGYSGYKAMKRALDEAGIEWYLMMPIQPLRGRMRRPDLRNHRKLVVVDGKTAFVGSQNMIEPEYQSKRNHKVGRRWHEAVLRVSGDIVSAIEAVFVVDWYTESGEVLEPEFPAEHPTDPAATPTLGGPVNAMQLVPSGPGFATEPNLRLFTALIHRSRQRLSIVSPYFVPEESLLAAMTTAAYRGVQVELFVSEQADQFMVHHAQSSYYRSLLEAGVHIFQLPKPAVLHAKFFTVDDEVGVIGSSNMDIRSFVLDYEISLLGTGGDLVPGLLEIIDRYKLVCHELTLQEWLRRPRLQRYLDNAMRLTSALQ